MTRRTCLTLALLALLGGCGDSKSPNASSVGGSGTSGASGGTSSQSAGGTSSSSGGSGATATSTGTTVDPSVMAVQPDVINELALDSSRVYWLEGHNRIMSIPLGGGTPSVVYASTTPGKYEALHIAVDASRLYFTDQGVILPPTKPRGVFSVPLDGSSDRTQLFTTTTVNSIAVDGGYLYFTANGSIARMPSSGGTATALVRNIDIGTPLALYGGYVYFWYAPDATFMQNVYRVSVDTNVGTLDQATGGTGGTGGANGTGGSGGTTGTAGYPAIAAEQISNTTRYSELILSPQVDQGYVYWAIYDEFYRWPVSGGTQEKFGVLSQGSVYMLLVDRGDIYWGAGSVQQFVVGGNSNTPVVTSSQGINAMAVNATDMYVGDGKLLRRVTRP